MSQMNENLFIGKKKNKETCVWFLCAHVLRARPSWLHNPMDIIIQFLSSQKSSLLSFSIYNNLPP